MASTVSICNQALSLLGEAPIISLDDDSNTAALCKANYSDLRDAVLEAGNWSFALQWLKLPKLASPPVSEYANAYEIPPNVIRIIFVGTSFNDPAEYTPMFVNVLAQRIAAELSIAITNSLPVHGRMMEMYETKLNEALSSDNSQGRAKKITSSWLQAGRVGGARLAGPNV